MIISLAQFCAEVRKINSPGKYLFILVLSCGIVLRKTYCFLIFSKPLGDILIQNDIEVSLPDFITIAKKFLIDYTLDLNISAVAVLKITPWKYRQKSLISDLFNNLWCFETSETGRGKWYSVMQYLIGAGRLSKSLSKSVSKTMAIKSEHLS